MTEQRKQAIIATLQGIVEAFEPTEEQPEIDMFYLISTYNSLGDNPELIGGDWAHENGFDL